MRRLALLALALLALPPSAAAQQAPVDLATLTADPFPDLIRPLQGITSTTLHARISCALTDGVQGIPLTYTVVEAPAWATIMVAPAQDQLATGSCDQGWIEATATLTATASDQAPAFRPAPIVVELTAGAPGREQRTRASVNASATYFAILDVQLAQSIAIVAPGGATEFTAMLTNLGNGATRVEAQLADAGEGLTVHVPAPVTLESRQAGGTRTTGDMVFRVTAAHEDGYVNRVGLVNARLVSAYAEDDSHAGDASSVSFLVTVRTGGDRGPDPENALPLASWAAPLALLGALLVRRTHRP